MSTQKRKYELRVRAERQADTRQRIAAATAELHQEVGPARTTIAEIARRAGVERLTVYNNFPEDYDLFAACQQHFLAENPPPDPSAAFSIEDPGKRLEAVLRELYDWYRRTDPMSANVARDRQLVPALDSLMADTTDRRLTDLTQALALGFSERGRPSRAVRAAVALTLDIWTWRSLGREGLAPKAAARLMAAAVRAAAEQA